MKPMTLIRRLFSAVFSFVLCAAFSVPASAESIVIHDARGRDITIGNPSRIVSIGGAITEILYALGLEERIVGIDTTSLYPQWQGMQYMHGMFSGRGRADHLDNDRYPGRTWTTIRDLLA